MDRRSRLWRRKSSEKSPGETESSGSVSSHSERYSDDQETFRASSNNASPNHAQSPELSANSSGEVNEKIKILTEKLSTALLNIRNKEDLVKQHAKVAEEAVSGWEKVETEVTSLKQRLEDATHKNSALENRISNLDGALKECVRQLRQSREEQEERIHDALAKKTREWESEKFKLETLSVELQAELEVTKAKVLAPADDDLQAKLEALEKENSALKVELLAQLDNLQMQTLESALSTRAAETASKQHLESIKKVTKLEAECRRLRAAARKTSINDRKLITSVAYVESLTDSQSDSGERLLGVENEQSCSDSWASALIAELDQFKNEKSGPRNLATSVEIDLMDDFLEMERLAALPEADCRSSSFDFEAGSDRTQTRDGVPKAELEIIQRRVAELEEKVVQVENERADVEMSLVKTRNELNNSSNQLNIAEVKLIELQKQLDLANWATHTIETEVEPVEEMREALESQLESSNLEVERLLEKMSLLEQKIEDERALSTKFAAKCCDLETVEENRKALQSELDSEHEEVGKLREKVDLLQAKVNEDAFLSAEFAAKCQDLEAMESKKKTLDIQLKISRVEVCELYDKVGLLEGEVNEKRALSAELAANVEALEAQKKVLESQLEFTNTEVHMILEKVSLLERKIEEERVLSVELAGKVEASETVKKVLESQLESANLEVRKLLEKVGLLERNIEDEMALSAELAAKTEAFEAKKKVFEIQLESATFEVGKLREEVSLLEMKVENERKLSTELAANAEASDAKKLEFECQLELEKLEVRKLHEKIAFLEMEFQKEKALSAELVANIEASDAKKMALESQLESANTEVGRLRGKVGMLERKASEEIMQPVEFAAKYQNLEDEVSRKRPEFDFRRSTALNGELKLRQEKELAVAAGKLVECQKTIASLGRQLKSLTDMEDFILEADKPEVNGDFRDLKRENMIIISGLSISQEKDFPLLESSLIPVSDYMQSCNLKLSSLIERE